jgi:hypothetical protein
VTGPLREERERVAALAARVREDRASLARHARALRERTGRRLATPAGLALCFVAGLALAPVASAAARTLLGARTLRGLALDSARLYRSLRDVPAAGTPRQETR